MIGPVHDRDVGVGAGQRAGRPDPAEPAAYDDHPVSSLGHEYSISRIQGAGTRRMAPAIPAAAATEAWVTEAAATEAAATEAAATEAAATEAAATEAAATEAAVAVAAVAVAAVAVAAVAVAAAKFWAAVAGHVMKAPTMRS
jgi:peptidoglycan DL-endopeptidase CwlO